ncbi:MAG: hypothetical protein HKO63_06135 [Acidimicrobiia bacterium]|nr:hypothetical protein [Acidimicrobiia bacterium]NNL97767.1 hypothetical protein [Acidimicrobiia bacterium]
MSIDLLLELQAAHAFDHAPLRPDLGVYHVPFGELTGDRPSPEDDLAGATLRGERTVVVGPPGSGKSSLIEHVLGPMSEGVAPMWIPVSGEPPELASNVQGVAGLVVQTIGENAALSDSERASARRASAPVQRTDPTENVSFRLGGGWMGAELSTELSRQAPPGLELPQTSQATLAVADQLLLTIQGADLMPVLVFDDTDRWFRGAGLGHREVAEAFFGRVLPELVQLHAGIVVAAQNSFLESGSLRDYIRTSVENRIDIPILASTEALALVLSARVDAHMQGHGLEEVIDPAAVARAYELYRDEFGGAVRDVIRTVHVALSEACNNRFDTVTVELIDGAAAW